MFLIAGLGNPGRRYEDTRHNIGFMLLDMLASAHDIDYSIHEKSACMGRGVIERAEVLLLKPLTYMNLCGEVVREISVSLSLTPSSIIAVYDDSDLPPGTIRLKKSGGSGGHRGVQSIINCLGTRDFQRLRLGIGSPLIGELTDYVLSPFAPEEKGSLDEELRTGVKAIQTLLKDGMDAAMNRFN